MQHIDLTIALLNRVNQFARMIISLALVAATALVTGSFFDDIYLAIVVHPFITGFIHAVGALLLLWTMVELIATETRLLRGGSIDVSIFVEVALVVILREIILLPVDNHHLTWVDLTMWCGAGLAMGLTYFLVRQGQRWKLKTTGD